MYVNPLKISNQIAYLSQQSRIFPSPFALATINCIKLMNSLLAAQKAEGKDAAPTYAAQLALRIRRIGISLISCSFCMARQC